MIQSFRGKRISSKVDFGLLIKYVCVIPTNLNEIMDFRTQLVTPSFSTALNSNLTLF